MLMLNSILLACILQAVHACSLYVNTTISMCCTSTKDLIKDAPLNGKLKKPPSGLTLQKFHNK